ncbi:hypothetical protein [Bradyrhizobium stylosanthis]|uniref:hypothetical protein n=1 Tax=Bradyrhizobium stylosanthis TaxID=1803665 RepID=UPI0012E81DFF|nr:hypothetical protein [Bradyrhizobium stylosanthis]
MAAAHFKFLPEKVTTERIKLKLFATEYAGKARSGIPACDKPSLHTVRDGGAVPTWRRRASCGCALQIFPAMVTDNILVIDARERLDAVSTRRAAGAVDRRHVKIVAARA